jgi:hypothetical protein
MLCFNVPNRDSRGFRVEKPHIEPVQDRLEFLLRHRPPAVCRAGPERERPACHSVARAGRPFENRNGPLEKVSDYPTWFMPTLLNDTKESQPVLAL